MLKSETQKPSKTPSSSRSTSKSHRISKSSTRSITTTSLSKFPQSTQHVSCPSHRSFSTTKPSNPSNQRNAYKFTQNPTMNTTDRSEYLHGCDLRSLENGIQLIFGDWDQDLIVINKPFGVPMAASHRDSITQRLKAITQKDNIFPVHRLDKYTSGCLVVALRAEVARVLQFSLQNHTLASIKTTKSNLLQKVKHGHIVQDQMDECADSNSNPVTNANAGYLLARNEQQLKDASKVLKTTDADTSWSKRYRVMVQLTPCVSRDLKSFMQQQYQLECAEFDQNRDKQPGSAPKPIDFRGNVSSRYLKYYEKYFTGNTAGKEGEKERGDQKAFNFIEKVETHESTSSPTTHRHSPDLIRSPHQDGTLYTPIYTTQQYHFHTDVRNNHQLLPPPLLHYGYLHSHLIQRDFLPNDWIAQHNVVHVDHITNNLEQRYKQSLAHSSQLPQHRADSNSTTNLDSSLSFTDAVGISGLDDIRIPMTTLHSSALYLEQPQTKQLKKLDLSATSSQSSRKPTVINTVEANPELKQDIDALLNSHSVQGLKNIRDAVEHRLLVPGAPKPPDNEDDDSSDTSGINKGESFKAGEIQQVLHDYLENIQQIDNLTQNTSNHGQNAINPLLHTYFSRLLQADGIAIAPFQWINSKIQLFEQVLKMHTVSHINSKLIKTVFRKAEHDDHISPDFNIASTGPHQMSTVGKFIIQDTTNQEGLLHFRENGVKPLAQTDGNVIHTHTADMYVADKDMIMDKTNLSNRSHPLHWTSHRVILEQNINHNALHSNNDPQTNQHQLKSFQEWSKIPFDAVPQIFAQFTNHTNDGNRQSPSSSTPQTETAPHKLTSVLNQVFSKPPLQPYELECGCLLPYTTSPTTKLPHLHHHDHHHHHHSVSTTPHSTHPTHSPSPLPKTHNPYSLLNFLPASAPHPFIPTSFLYESAPIGTERASFMPTRHLASLPQDIPEAILHEFTTKQQTLQKSQEETLALKNQIQSTLSQLEANPDGEAAMIAENDQQFEHVAALTKNLKTKLRQKQERNNSRFVNYDWERHGNSVTTEACVNNQQREEDGGNDGGSNCNQVMAFKPTKPRFGSLLASSRFDPASPVLSTTNTTTDGEQGQGRIVVESNPIWNASKKGKIPSTFHPQVGPTNTTSKSGSENILISLPVSDAKEATTLFRVTHLNLEKNIAIYNAKLLSGRTHQLRIHFSDAGLPIRGDPYYNPYYIKHWLNLYTHAYYVKDSFNSHLRSIFARPLFGYCDSGVTSQFMCVDDWKQLIAPNCSPTSSLIDKTQQNAHTKPLLSYAQYTPSTLLDIENTTIVPFNATQSNPLHKHPFYAPEHAVPTTNEIASTTLSNVHKSPHQQLSPGTNPTPLQPHESISPEELEYYLSVYKAFAEKEIDGEMFLQSYLIEFPLPAGVRMPKGMRQQSSRHNKKDHLKQILVDRFDEQGVSDPSDDSQIVAKGLILDQLNRPGPAHKYTTTNINSADKPRQDAESLLNPILKDGLPLYHSRLSPEEVKAERLRRKNEKKATKQRKDAIQVALEQTIRSPNGSETAQDPSKPDTIQFIDTNHLMPAHEENAKAFFESPDDLDQYFTASPSDSQDFDDEITYTQHTPHPDGFYDIEPLFDYTKNPIFESLQNCISSDQFKTIYNPFKQLSQATLHHSDKYHQRDTPIELNYCGHTVSTNISNVLHLSTEYKSWTFKTANGTEMVRILLNIPKRWKYAM